MQQNAVLATVKSYPVRIWATDMLPSLNQVVGTFTTELGIDYNAVAARIAATGNFAQLGEFWQQYREVIRLDDQRGMLRSAARHGQLAFMGNYLGSKWMAPEYVGDYAETAAEGAHRETFAWLVSMVPNPAAADWNRWMVAAIRSEDEDFAKYVLDCSMGAADEIEEFLWQAEARDMPRLEACLHARVPRKFDE